MLVLCFLLVEAKFCSPTVNKLKSTKNKRVVKQGADRIAVFFLGVKQKKK